MEGIWWRWDRRAASSASTSCRMSPMSRTWWEAAMVWVGEGGEGWVGEGGVEWVEGEGGEGWLGGVGKGWGGEVRREVG